MQTISRLIRSMQDAGISSDAILQVVLSQAEDAENGEAERLARNRMKVAKCRKNKRMCNVTAGYTKLQVPPIESIHTPSLPSEREDTQERKEDKGFVLFEVENQTDQKIAALEIYNSIASSAGWPVVKKLTDSRKVSLRKRISEAGGIDGWRAALERAAKSSFLCGANKTGWKAGFDFFMQQSSFTKLIEGSYDDRASKLSGSTQRDFAGAFDRLRAKMGNRSGGEEVFRQDAGTKLRVITV